MIDADSKPTIVSHKNPNLAPPAHPIKLKFGIEIPLLVSRELKKFWWPYVQPLPRAATFSVFFVDNFVAQSGRPREPLDIW